MAEELKNEKALFRRGKARAALGQSDSAKDDLRKAQLISPGDRAVALELRQIQKAEREGRKEQRKMFKGMFKDEIRQNGRDSSAPIGIVQKLIQFWILLVGYVKRLFGSTVSTRLKGD